jgi:hypothetical protein
VSGWIATLPRLITNPPGDGAFRDAAEAAIETLPPGNGTPAALAAALRDAYPRASPALVTSLEGRESSGTCTVMGGGPGDGIWRLRTVVMDELEDDLRATAGAIAADADRLAAIEQEKEGLASSDPRLLALSAEAEAIAKKLVPKTIAERALAAETNR